LIVAAWGEARPNSLRPRGAARAAPSRKGLERRAVKPIGALASDSRGGGVVEYVIIIGCIAILAFAGFKAFGGQVKDQITKQTTTLKAVPTDGK
jgi:Flp pilus assembly pilin Flp